MQLDSHPTVMQYRERSTSRPVSASQNEVDAEWLKALARGAGADDAGLVEIDRPELADQKEDILAVFPATRTLISLVCRLNPENIRCVNRAISDTEFSQTFHEANRVSQKVAAALAAEGMRALAPPSGFPMDMRRWPGKMWNVSHKQVAEAAGMGTMGLHRLVIHPKFGSYIVLGSLLLDRQASRYDRPMEYNPCLDCKLCMAVCPAGLDNVGPYLEDRKQYLAQVVKPLQEFPEPVFVVALSDAEETVRKRFPNKQVRRVSNGLRPDSARGFFQSMDLIFQPGRAEGLNATYHFTFTGTEACQGTVVIDNKTIAVHDGLVGNPDLQVTADSQTWIDFLAKEKNLLWALAQRKIRIKGPPRLMKAFAGCFPA